MVMAKKIEQATSSMIKHWKIKKKYLKSDDVYNKKESLFNTAQVLTISILVSLFSLIMGIAIARPVFKTENNIKGNEPIKKFIEQYLSIKDQYYDDIDDESAMKTAIESIINSLDEHSTVVDASLSNTLSTSLLGEYQGFGIQIANDNANNIIVVDVFEDTPASKAGMLPYDIIKKLDDTVVEGMSTTDFTEIVKKSPKSSFNILVNREGKDITLKLTRSKVVLKSVATKTFEKNNKKIGYIYVSLFAHNTDIQFKEALVELEKQGIDSLIVDLRYNTGGHLTAVENMMSEFLDKSHIIYQIQTKTDITKYYSKTKESRDYDMVVLVNEYSASASEMFTATMKEEYGATIIGVTTYGKGTVQEVMDSSSTDDQYKLTTKKWLTPKGNWINKKGIEPNIKVELNPTTNGILTDEEDNQLQEAIKVLSK